MESNLPFAPEEVVKMANAYAWSVNGLREADREEIVAVYMAAAVEAEHRDRAGLRENPEAPIRAYQNAYARGECQKWFAMRSKIAKAESVSMQMEVVGEEGEERTLADMMEGRPAPVVEDMDREAIIRAIASLPVEQDYIITGIYFQEKSTVELAREMGISEGYVCQLRQKAEKALAYKLKGMAAYLAA